MFQPGRAPVDISIILPTFRRPLGLKAALESLLIQSAPGKTLKIIVADNDPDGSARAYINSVNAGLKDKVTYIHVPNPGVANVRNAALEFAQGRYIAFLDDDQVAAPNWLSVLIAQSEAFDACAVFTKINAASGIDVKHKAEILKFFSRHYPKPGSMIIDDFFGCGSALIDRQRCEIPDPPFCASTNETGGEDDRFFSALKIQGGRMVWTDETSVIENVDDNRMAAHYVRLRSFVYGQAPSRLCAPPNRLNLLGLIRWTIIGAAQFGVYGILYTITHLAGSRHSIAFMRRACEGAGKVFWYERFRPKIYGQTTTGYRRLGLRRLLKKTRLEGGP